MPKQAMRARLNAFVQKNNEAHKAASADVTIRDILVVTPIGRVGEFEKISKEQGESEASLISRIISQINMIAQKASSIHIKDNFRTNEAGSLCMKAEKTNAITRVTFNEFYFYPSREHGPLTKTGFDDLVLQIEALARTYPDNLHLTLASFAVMDEQHHLHNMVLYVQCGSDVKMQSFAKAIAASLDPEYPNTTLMYMKRGGKAESKRKEIAEKGRLLGVAVSERDAVSALRWLAVLEKHFLQAPSSTAITLLRSLLKQFREDFKNKLIDETSDKQIKALYTCINTQLDKMEKKYRKSVKDTKAAIQKESFQSSNLTSEAGIGLAVNYGGNIACVTAGGETFTTLIDICYDHSHGVAKHQYFQAMKQNTRSMPTVLPMRLSQVLTSNSISVSSEHVLGGSLVHADPAQYKVIEKIKPKVNSGYEALCVESMVHFASVFGEQTEIRVYPIKKLATLTGPLGDLVDHYNQAALGIKFLTHLQANADLHADVLQEINDLKLRVAVVMADTEQVEALVALGADLFYEGATGVASMALVPSSGFMHAWLMKSDVVAMTFNHQRQTATLDELIALTKKIIALGYFERLTPCITDDFPLAVRRLLFEVAIQCDSFALVKALLAVYSRAVRADGFLTESVLNALSQASRGLIFVVVSGLPAKDVKSWIKTMIQEGKSVQDVVNLFLQAAIEKKDGALTEQALALGANPLHLNLVESATLILQAIQAGHGPTCQKIYRHLIHHQGLTQFVSAMKQRDEMVTCFNGLVSFVIEQEDHPSAVIELLLSVMVAEKVYSYLTEFLDHHEFVSYLSASMRNKVHEMSESMLLFSNAIMANLETLASDYLLEGYRPDFVMANGYTPLTYVIKHGLEKLFILLLKHGVDFQLSDKHRSNPIDLMVIEERWGMLSLAMDHGVKVVINSIVKDEIKAAFLTTINKLIQAQRPDFAHVNQLVVLMHRLGVPLDFGHVPNGKNVLFEATKMKKVQVVEWLLKHGAKASLTSSHQTTLFHIAIQENDLPIFKLFLESGLTPTECDSIGRTPLYWTIILHRARMTDLLLAKMKVNLNVNMPILDSLPLHYAVETEDPALVDVLLAHGADINLIDQVDGYTPLFVAITGSLSMVQYLLKKGADPRGCDKKKRPPHLFALKKDEVEAAGVIVNQLNQGERRAISWLFKPAPPTIAREKAVSGLLQHGPNGSH